MGGFDSIKKFLEEEKVVYQILEHQPAYTALEVAEAQHLPGRQLIKVVIVRVEGKFIMCVLSSVCKIDFKKLAVVLAKEDLALASEAEVATLFPNYETGAMPPFGQLVGLKVYVDKKLEENDTIAFNAGTHTDLMRIKFKDFVRLTRPAFADFSIHI